LIITDIQCSRSLCLPDPHLHRWLEIPVLGVIENMSYFECMAHKKPRVYYPLGRSKLDEIAEEFGVEVLGRIPVAEEIAEGINSGNPILPRRHRKVIDNICEKIVKTPLKKIGFLEKLKKEVVDAIRPHVEQVIVSLLVSIKKHFDLGAVRERTGFTESKPFWFVVTDRSGLKEITRVCLKVEEDGVEGVKNPRKVDFEIASDFQTFARMILGKKKVDGEWVGCDPMDFWLMGDVKVYGRGFTPRTIAVFRNVFGDESLMRDVRAKYSKVLERWA